MYSSFLSIMGRHKEAIQQSQRAVTLDPLSCPFSTQLGIAYYFAGDFNSAVKQLRRTLALDSSFGLAHKRLGLALERQGLFKEAGAEISQWRPSVSQIGFEAVRAQLEASMGNRSEANRLLTVLLATNTKKDLESTDFAMIYAALGDTDHALKWLEQGYAEQDVGLTLIGVDPRYDSIRNDSRFRDLLKRLKLPASSRPN